MNRFRSPFRSLLLLTVLLLPGTAALLAAGEQRIGIAFTTQGFAGIRTTYDYSPGEGIRFGLFCQGSLLMLVQGDTDTGEAGFSAGIQRSLGPGWFWEGGLDAGYRWQNQNTGTVSSLFTGLTARAGRTFGPAEVALEAAWEQTWIAGIRYSDFVRDTFTDLYEDSSPPPEGTLLVLPSCRFRTGVSALWTLGEDLRVSLRGGALWTPNPFVSGFQGMMFGFFPFYADLGVGIGW